MEVILVLIIVTLVFSVTVGLIIMNRDELPDVLVEELNEVLDEKRKELEINDMINEQILNEKIDVIVTDNNNDVEELN